MGYESDPAGIGVPRDYGAKSLGGAAGELHDASGESKRMIFDVTIEAIDYPYSREIDGDLYYLEEMSVEITDAFDTGATLNISVDSGAGVTTAVPLDNAGIVVRDLAADTTLANQTGSSGVDLELSLNSLATASSDGDARVVVKYKRA